MTDIDVPYSVLSPSTAIAPLDPGWNPGSNLGIPAAILGGIGALGVTQGIDVASQTPGAISSFLDAFEDRQKAIQEAYNARYGPSPNYGMGVGGGPDAANMSLDDFGISSPPGEHE